MYVCGITPYDATHLGHAATYLAFDLVQRVWRDAGHDVHYVQNVTDVDDPLLERAAQTGEDWTELAEREIELFREDMTALRVLPPDDYVGAVEAIPEIADGDRPAARPRRGLPRRRGHLLRRRPRTGGSATSPDYDRDDDAALFAERGGDPDRAGQAGPARLAAVARRSAAASRPGTPRSARAGRAGTSSAR